jgi:hypothetical protein
LAETRHIEQPSGGKSRRFVLGICFESQENVGARYSLASLPKPSTTNRAVAMLETKAPPRLASEGGAEGK